MNDPLLEKLAAAFEDGRTLDGHFLQENNVSAEDSIALTTRLAAILRGYIAAPEEIQVAILSAGVSEDKTLVSFIFYEAWRVFSMRRIDELTNKIMRITP